MIDFNKDGKYDKNDLKYIIAFVLILTAVILIFCGFWVSPTGIIDSSVITMVGLIFAFVGSILGIDAHYNAILQRYKEENKDK